jgi:phospholipid/cholesterol/gamma-HCH transport system permease protein
MEQVLGKIGRKAAGRFNYLLDLLAFTSRILGFLIGKKREGKILLRRIIVEQIYFTAVQALPVIIPIALIIGTMMIVQFTQVSSQYELGKIIVMLIIREFGPLITALVVILRSATAVTIETGYMTIGHEIESIEMAGIDPVQFISSPRLIGITSAVLCLFVVFDLVAIIGGYAVVWMTTSIPMGNFLGQISKAITAPDLAVGIVKGLCFGVAITVASLYRGFTVQKDITFIPIATSRAAVDCLVYCLVINIIISGAFFYLW